MYLGKIVEIAAKRAIYADPQHPYTQALIAAVPVLRPQDRGRGRRERVAGEIPSALNPPAGCRFHTRCPHVMAICRTQEPLLPPPRPAKGRVPPNGEPLIDRKTQILLRTENVRRSAA